MLATNFKLLRKNSACEEGYRKLAKNLGGLNKYGRETPITFLQVLESNGLEDTVWCFCATVENSDKMARLFAVYCAYHPVELPVGPCSPCGKEFYGSDSICRPWRTISCNKKDACS